MSPVNFSPLVPNKSCIHLCIGRRPLRLPGHHPGVRLRVGRARRQAHREHLPLLCARSTKKQAGAGVREICFTYCKNTNFSLAISTNKQSKLITTIMKDLHKGRGGDGVCWGWRMGLLLTKSKRNNYSIAAAVEYQSDRPTDQLCSALVVIFSMLYTSTVQY